MDIKRNVAGLFFVAVGGLGLLAACGEIDGEEACTFDDDCSGDQVCDQTVCTDTCTTSADCGTDEECVARPGGAEGSVCREAEVSGDDCNDAGNECTDGLVCDQFTGDCVEPGDETPEYYTVRINDVTDAEAPDRCDDTTMGFNSAGAKIMYVVLEDGSGNVVAYGTGVGDDIDAAESDFLNTFDVLDGSPPDYAGECPTEEAYFRANGDEITTAFREDTVVALGCGGSVYVQFEDENGDLILLDDSYTIRVGEFGPNCNGPSHPAQSDPDYYDLYVCTAAGSNVSSDESCAAAPMNAAALTGVTTSNVSLPADEA